MSRIKKEKVSTGALTPSVDTNRMNRINYTSIDSKKQVLSLLELTTKENRATRRILSMAAGISDRQVRNIIEDLRRKGHRICSSSYLDGYWMARSEKEFQDFLSEYTAHARATFRTANAMSDQGQGGESIVL